MSYDLVAKFRLNDQLTLPVRKMTSAVKTMTTASSAASSKISATAKATASYASDATKAANHVKSLTAQNEKLAASATKAKNAMKNGGGEGGSGFGGLVSGIGKAAVAGGVAGIAAGVTMKTMSAIGDGARAGAGFIADSLDKALDYEAQLSTIKALTGATGAEMKTISDLALNMGAKTKYSALEAAKGIEELLKAGLTPAAVRAGGLEAALNLATAGGLELANAAEIMSTALNAYKRDGLTAADASNILAGTANASATGVEELRYSLASVSAVAAGIGMTFKDTNAAMGLFANNGFKGSDAGTSLKTMLQNLQPQTKTQIALFNKLGITTNGAANKFFTADGRLRSLSEVADTLRTSLKGLNDMQRQAALEAMFGTDAIRAGIILYNEGADGVQKFHAEMGKVSALQVAKEKMDNGRGAIEQFMGALETFQIRALTPLLPAVKSAFDGMGTVIERNSPKIIAAITTATDVATKWINEKFVNNQAFRDMSFTAKIGFVFDSLKAVFDEWFNSTGKAVVDEYARKITDQLATTFENSIPQMTSIGARIGSELGMSIMKELIAHVQIPEYMSKTIKFITGKEFGNGKEQQAFYGPPDPNGSHAGGLDRVPYNGYSARLHKDETVLNKADSDAYRSSRGSARGGVLVTGNTFNVRQDSDIDAIADALATRILQAEEAGVYGG